MVRIFGIVLFLLIGGLAAYEAHAVWRADNRSDEILRAALAKPQEIKVADLTSRQRQILLAVEDPGFDRHRGVDFTSPGQGMTTITQALVKLLYFDHFKPGFAKIEQSLIARFVLNERLSKDDQLALFVNQAYFGHYEGQPLRGFAQAARFYFSKPFETLSEDEYVGLVGMLIGPNALRPDRHPQAFEARRRTIFKLLAGRCKPEGVLDPWFKGCERAQSG